ncbi:MAG TPA: hypothetical protein VEJ16_09385 [Alphaproteobacteria bacterium]|nr:hypothetical protein [Alphaproteobacteria bacterium]
MSIWQRQKRPEISEGAAFRHPQPGAVTETARVLSLCSDPLGIPHVRFMVSYEKSERTILEDGPRILSLTAFASRYREPSAA